MSGRCAAGRGPGRSTAVVLGKFHKGSMLLTGCILSIGLASCQLPEWQEEQDAGLTRGAVVSEHPLATAAGLGVLEAGGNAADAAVATALALAVVYPQAGNLGGGGFALCSGFERPASALDFREVAPASTRPELYLNEQGQVDTRRSVQGPLSVGVPGSPLGLYELYREYGSGNLGWPDLVAPAIRLAERGFAVDPWLARDLRRDSTRRKMNAAAHEVFYPQGEPLEAGERLVQADLAKTLLALSSGGPKGFYQGPVARAMLETLATEAVPGVGVVSEGIIELADLEAYRSAWRKPLRGRFEGYELISMPPPSSGGLVVLQTLAMIEDLPLAAEMERSEDSAHGLRWSEALTHWFIEALRRSFADRAEHMGDPDFHDVPVEALLSREWILARRASIGARADLEVGAWVEPNRPESKETTHLSVVDASGAAVSMTTTLNGSFGSGILVDGAGFLLNNELDDFSIQAGVPNQFGLVGNQANAIRGGKRPLSSMSPTIVRNADGRLRLVVGSPGGPRIITSVTQVLLRTLLFGEDLRDAIEANRLHQQWRPEATRFEAEQGGGPQAELLDALRERGHPLEVVDRRYGSVQGIWIDDRGEPHAVSDTRRGGAGGVVGKGVQAPALPPE